MCVHITRMNELSTQTCLYSKSWIASFGKVDGWALFQAKQSALPVSCSMPVSHNHPSHDSSHHASGSYLSYPTYLPLPLLILFALVHSGEHEGSRRLKTELLVQMDGLAKSSDLVFLLAASNLPW